MRKHERDTIEMVSIDKHVDDSNKADYYCEFCNGCRFNSFVDYYEHMVCVVNVLDQCVYLHLQRLVHRCTRVKCKRCIQYFENSSEHNCFLRTNTYTQQPSTNDNTTASVFILMQPTRFCI
jgi:hypothetical protein